MRAFILWGAIFAALVPLVRTTVGGGAGPSIGRTGIVFDTAAVTLYAFGDVSLGRRVGQQLLAGDLDYPFRFVRDSLQRADVVFVNLESQLTDQGGETQHPRHNLIFCGPPEGGEALKRANIGVVSTANNHAFDYGQKGLRETIASLRSGGIAFAGTSEEPVPVFPPAVIEVKGIRIGFVAYTQFVNIPGKWQGQIAVFNAEGARREIAEARTLADVVIASYHGGAEYVEKPSVEAIGQMRALIDSGADVVLGHHPHVPQGIEEYRGRLIFRSLGNFVFYQPQHVWTQKSFGVELRLRRDGSNVGVRDVRLLPLRAGLQPSFELAESERQSIIDRIKKLSNVDITESETGYYVRASAAAH